MQSQILNKTLKRTVLKTIKEKKLIITNEFSVQFCHEQPYFISIL
jgi:hypothetical protein